MDIAEKRVYGDRTGATVAFVATDAGLARVSVSGDKVGEFGLVHRGGVRDVAVADGRLAVAADDVLVAIADGEFAAAGFGPAEAVGFDGATLYAAGDGEVARYDDGSWTTTADLDGVRALAGDLAAAADGVFRVDGTGVGLDDARDVVADPQPLAATGDGLYYLANGWLRAAEGSFRAVAVGGDRAVAATADTLSVRDGDTWVPRDVPAPDLAAVARGPATTYAVSRDGTFCVDAGDGWRTRALGLPGVRAVAVPLAADIER
jgi:hypothetical protein